MNYKLYKKLAKFKGVVDCSPNMIVITDIDGVIEYSNDTHEAVTGFSGDQALGRKGAAFNGSFNGDIKSTLEKGQKVSFN